MLDDSKVLQPNIETSLKFQYQVVRPLNILMYLYKILKQCPRCFGKYLLYQAVGVNLQLATVQQQIFMKHKKKIIKCFRVFYRKMFFICMNCQIFFVKAVILNLQIYLAEFIRVSIYQQIKKSKLQTILALFFGQKSVLIFILPLTQKERRMQKQQKN